MLSSDKNVETIAQLIEVLKRYFVLQKEYLELDVIDKVVRLLTATALAIVFFLIAIGILLFFWLGMAFWMGHYIGMTWAFLVVASINAIVLLLFIALRKPLVERPLVRFLARLFMS